MVISKKSSTFASDLKNNVKLINIKFMKKKCKLAWESVLESRIYSSWKEACHEAERYCRLNEIKFNPYKHVKLVYIWM